MFDWRNTESYLKKLNSSTRKKIVEMLTKEREDFLKANPNKRYKPSRELRQYARENGYKLTLNVSKYVPAYTYYID